MCLNLKALNASIVVVVVVVVVVVLFSFLSRDLNCVSLFQPWILARQYGATSSSDSESGEAFFFFVSLGVWFCGVFLRRSFAKKMIKTRICRKDFWQLQNASPAQKCRWTSIDLLDFSVFFWSMRFGNSNPQNPDPGFGGSLWIVRTQGTIATAGCSDHRIFLNESP